MNEDECTAIGRQLGIFLRRADRLHGDVRSGDGEPRLERAAFILLARIATGGPMRLSALAAEMCVDLSVVSRQVAALEAAGLVARTPDPSDGRASLIGATDKGAAVFARKRDRFVGALRELLADWSPAERREFARLLTRFNDAIAARSGGVGHHTWPAEQRREPAGTWAAERPRSEGTDAWIRR